MTASKIRNLFWSKKVFLFDLDGTLYLGNKVIPGARELIEKLSSEKKKVFYFTNNSSRSEGEYVRKLKKLGFSCRKEQIVMSTHSLITQLKKDRVRKIFLLGTPSMQGMLKSGGIQAVQKKPQAVVVGFDKTLTYKKLAEACRLVHGGVPYYVTHPDYFCPTEIGPEPDCGSFALVIEKTTKKTPKLVLGKPNPLMIGEVRKRLKTKATDIILVGDRLMTDIFMAKKAAIDSILVLSGDNTQKDLMRSPVRPSGVLRSVRELL